MWDNICLVVRNLPGTFYLTNNDGRNQISLNKNKAWTYRSTVAFTDAEDHNLLVYLRFPTGREILVSKEDFYG